jgi:Tol biopolymer transport system component
MCLLTPAQAVAPKTGESLPAKPVRLLTAPIPATIAFTSHDALWLMDGYNVKAQPLLVTYQGVVQLVDWSPNGEWFAFLRYPSDRKRDEATLWVTRSDGHVVQQVDQAVIWDTPQWSPVENALVYRTRDDAKPGAEWG